MGHHLQRPFVFAALTVALGAVALPRSARTAAASAYDGMDYEPGTHLAGHDGGQGWDGAWGEHGPGSPTIEVAKGLTFGNLIVSAGACATTSDSPIGDDRKLALNYGEVGKSTFFSCLLRPLDAVDNKYFGFGDGSLLWGKGGRHGNYGIEVGGGNDFVDSGIPARKGETVLLVVRVAHAVKGRLIDLWVNPSPGEPLPDDSDASAVDPDTSPHNLLGFGTDLHCIFDELRVGNSFSAVCPTPPKRDVTLRLFTPPHG